MKSRDLAGHKSSAKILSAAPVFSALKKNKLPKPFSRMGGSRIESSKLIDVSPSHQVLFVWRNGENLTDTAFYGYLLSKLANGAIAPIFEFHWHPSHKGMHCKVPCDTDTDYTGRLLIRAPELALSGSNLLDPRSPGDRHKLILRFCSACGITVGPQPKPDEPELWQ